MKTLICLPNEIMYMIWNVFLTKTDQLSVMLTKKKIYQIITNYPEYGPMMIYKNILYPSELIRSYYNTYVPKNREILMFTNCSDMIYADAQLRRITSDDYMNNLWKSLRNPDLVCPLLRRSRDTFLTNSSFQKFLADIQLYKEKYPYTQCSDIQKINDFNCIEEMRYYQYDDVNASSDFSCLYVTIVNFIRTYCSFCRQYLENLEDDDIFLSEYIRIWEEYSIACCGLHSSHEFIARIINKLYNKKYVEYEEESRFSMWRLFIKIFQNEIYKKCSERYFKSYLNGFINNWTQDDLLKRGMFYLEDISIDDRSVHLNSYAMCEDESPKWEMVKMLISVLSTRKNVKDFIRQIYSPIITLVLLQSINEDVCPEMEKINKALKLFQNHGYSEYERYIPY